jgi:N-acetylglucosaminyl-diphospho-decaprenol L-rhamnosyltransferase
LQKALNAVKMTHEDIEVSVIVVSYNTKALTLKCLQTLYATTKDIRFETIVWDNNSSDGSADAIAREFPSVRLCTAHENSGFAAANNAAAKLAQGRWLVLLNPDTEVHERAVAELLAIGAKHPGAGLYGGKTVYPDGSLNEYSCLYKMTPWSVFCRAFFLEAIFKGKPLFDREVKFYWKRDTILHVDIIVGCWLLIARETWERLGGFNTKYWMYGEDVDLSLRAKAIGLNPIINPSAIITHIVGASSNSAARKIIPRTKARVTLIKDHWPGYWHRWGLLMERAWVINRLLVFGFLALTSKRRWGPSWKLWQEVWQKRKEWSTPYFEK